MKRTRMALLAGALLLCAGCGHFVDPDATMKAYRETAPTVADLPGLGWQPLAYPSETEFAITEKSPMMDLGPLGKSYVKGFELPKADVDYRLVVRSYVLRNGLLGLVIFVPVVSVLDAEMKPIGMSRPSDIVPRQGRLFDEMWKPAYYEISTPVPRDSGARYILVHTSRALIEYGRRGETAPTTRIAATSYVPLYIPLSNGMPGNFPGSPIGDLKVFVQPSRD